MGFVPAGLALGLTKDREFREEERWVREEQEEVKEGECRGERQRGRNTGRGEKDFRK